MSKRSALLLLLVLIAAGWALPARAWHGYVSKVKDGDSLVVKRGGTFHEIRLYGIDAPEHGQPYSDRARWFVHDLARKRTVTIESVDRDHYGRIVALVKVSGRLLNRELVRNGLAWVYPKYCTDRRLCTELAGLEKKARRNRYGLWKDNNPIAPWEWKRVLRETGSPPGPATREYRFLNQW